MRTSAPVDSPTAPMWRGLDVAPGGEEADPAHDIGVPTPAVGVPDAAAGPGPAGVVGQDAVAVLRPGGARGPGPSRGCHSHWAPGGRRRRSSRGGTSRTARLRRRPRTPPPCSRVGRGRSEVCWSRWVWTVPSTTGNTTSANTASMTARAATARAHRRHSDRGPDARRTHLLHARTIARPSNQMPATRVATPPTSRTTSANVGPPAAASGWTVRSYTCTAPFAAAATPIRAAIATARPIPVGGMR